ncbi:MAG: hypothetical protein H7Y86_09715 [Rhizobacter sp.]|nr:hypothetical protein [Ferruginibacter sp.]
MRQIILIILLMIGLNGLLFAQNNLQPDSVQIFRNDIYSNFNNVNYNPSTFKVVYSGNILDSNGQPAKLLYSDAYFDAITIAENYFNSADYNAASKFYKTAFIHNENRAMPFDRLGLAACYAEMSWKDSAFKELSVVFKDSSFVQSAHELKENLHFKNLHQTKQWKKLVADLDKRNKPAAKLSEK